VKACREPSGERSAQQILKNKLKNEGIQSNFIHLPYSITGIDLTDCYPYKNAKAV